MLDEQIIKNIDLILKILKGGNSVVLDSNKTGLKIKKINNKNLAK